MPHSAAAGDLGVERPAKAFGATVAAVEYFGHDAVYLAPPPGGRAGGGAGPGGGAPAGPPGGWPARLARGAGTGGAFFWYPRRGFGTISERLAEAAEAAGAELRFGAAAERVALETEGATVTLAGGATVAARRVWSTIPLPALARIAAPAPPAALLEAAGRPRFRAMVLAYLVLDGDRYSPYDAHYLPDAGTPVTRVSEPKNYRDGDDPPGRTVLCAELPCERDGALWRAGGGELAEPGGAAPRG